MPVFIGVTQRLAHAAQSEQWGIDSISYGVTVVVQLLSVQPPLPFSPSGLRVPLRALRGRRDRDVRPTDVSSPGISWINGTVRDSTYKNDRGVFSARQ